MIHSFRRILLIALIVSPVLFPAVSAENKSAPASHKIEFGKLDSDGIPQGWTYQGKLGVPDVKYEIVKDAESGKNVLKISSSKATGTLLFNMEKIDLEQYPVMRWKWKMEKLPAGADGRKKDVDDQALGIYMGYGRLSQESMAYRWETKTPIGEKGDVNYGGGFVKVHWLAIRNETSPMNQWVVEEYKVCRDFKKAIGKTALPSGIALSVVANSQYTGTDAVSYLEYIEFLPASEGEKSAAGGNDPGK